MSRFAVSRRWARIGNSGVAVLFAWAVWGCGDSTLKTVRPEAGVDSPLGWAGGSSAGSTVDANGGTTSIPDAPTAGSGGQGGTTTIPTTTGGASGRDAAAEVPSGGGGSVGGSTGTGSVVGTGGVLTTGGATGKGGQTTGGGIGTGGRPATGGITSKGGQTGTGGVVSTGGRTSTGGTAGVATGGVMGVDGGIDGGTSAVALALEPLAKAFCAAARTCCRRDGFYTMDLDDCEAKLPARLHPFPLLEQGIVTIDPIRLAACVSAYQSAVATCAVADVDAACYGLWVGTRAEGQTCGGTGTFGAFECQAKNGAAACSWQDAASYPAGKGVCVALPRGKAGDPCSKTCGKNQDCIVDLVGEAAPLSVMCFEEDGLYCAVTANPPVCKTYSKIGEPCTYFGGCDQGNYCDWNDHVCKVAAKLGESCMGTSCTDGTICATGNWCIVESLASSDVCIGKPSVP